VIQWKASTWAAVTFKKNLSTISSKLGLVIWSCDTGQQIPCFDRCQLTLTWMSNIKDEEASHKRGQVTILAAFLPSRSKSAEFPHEVLNATEKRGSAFLSLVFALFSS